VTTVDDVVSLQLIGQKRWEKIVVRQTKSIVIAALCATAGFAAGLGAAPAALADTCDPTATICQGDVDTNPAPPPAAPQVDAADQYPFDEDWYFNPAGGGTILQPVHPSGGGGGHH
jgi:hypothetical protein